MNELTHLYTQMGISPAVYAYGEAALSRLRERFDAIDQVAEYNQAKVLAAFRKNRVSATCFAASTGYGYNDEGRDKLEQVYADVFHTEAALVRPQITCGTHALAVALSANLLPGDELLSPVGAPYDTLEEVIGIRESKCSLKEYGVTYAQADLKPDGSFEYDAIRANGDAHVITFCCCWDFAALPDPADYEWENVKYQYHWYNWEREIVPFPVFYIFKDFFNLLCKTTLNKTNKDFVFRNFWLMRNSKFSHCSISFL